MTIHWSHVQSSRQVQVIRMILNKCYKSILTSSSCAFECQFSILIFFASVCWNHDVSKHKNVYRLYHTAYPHCMLPFVSLFFATNVVINLCNVVLETFLRISSSDSAQRGLIWLPNRAPSPQNTFPRTLDTTTEVSWGGLLRQWAHHARFGTYQFHG